jgi:hypothetical protein
MHTLNVVDALKCTGLSEVCFGEGRLQPHSSICILKSLVKGSLPSVGRAKNKIRRRRKEGEEKEKKSNRI